jgi:hypothetical protein
MKPANQAAALRLENTIWGDNIDKKISKRYYNPFFQM